MDTLLIKIRDNKARRLLKDLEDLEIIEIIKNVSPRDPKLSDKYAGKLPAIVADEMQEYLSNSRKEWEDRSI